MIASSRLHRNVLVCIPAYNAATSLNATIESLYRQTFQNFDVVIMDNNSTDDTVSIAQTLAHEQINERVYIIKNDMNIGRIGNWNKCIDFFLETHCSYLKFLFAGDTLEPNALSALTKTMNETAPDVGLAVGAYTIQREGNMLSVYSAKKDMILPPIGALSLFVKSGNWIGPPLCTLIRKDALEGRRFSDQIPWAADWKLYIDMCCSHNVVYLHHVVGTMNLEHRKHVKQFTSSISAREDTHTVHRYAYESLAAIDQKKARPLYHYVILNYTRIGGDDVLPSDIVNLILNCIKRYAGRTWRRLTTNT